MTDNGDHIRDAAIGWAMRLAEPTFDDWDGFTAWLEAAPAHLPAYEAALAAGEAADPALEALPAPAPVRVQRAGWWRQAAGGAISAAIIAGCGVSYLFLRPEPYTVRTGPGEHRTVSLGTATIALNGDTTLRLDRHNPHLARLESGEALFEVRHDEAHPFAVQVGDGEVRDVGTRFDVTHDATGTRVAVAEGMVVYNPKAEAVRLGPGQTLDSRAGAGTLQIARAATADIGSWREDRLSYRQAPIATVAADLSRGLGFPITADSRVEAQRFTGVISYGGDKARFMGQLGALLDVGVKQDQGRWVLTRKADARL
jgi:transmembrane sensor